MESINHLTKYNNILISVIVPVYKVEPYLKRCLDSIINQSYHNLDIILIDDGSPDRCGDICEQYALKDSRIRVYHTENRGLSGARNFGLEKAFEINSAYIGFVDSDDWIELNMYDEMVHLLEQSAADIAICDFVQEYKNKKVKFGILDKGYNNIELIRFLLLSKINNMVWNKLYKKYLFSVYRFPKGHNYEDIVTVYKIFSLAGCAVSISRPLYHYCMRSGAITQTRTLKNLVDCWLAHKERFVFFKNTGLLNRDKEVYDKMRYYCAAAITRTWVWYYPTTEKERNQYASRIEEMKDFSRVNYSAFGDKGWPLKLKFSFWSTRFNSKLVFFLLYYLNCFYRYGMESLGYKIK